MNACKLLCKCIHYILHNCRLHKAARRNAGFEITGDGQFLSGDDFWEGSWSAFVCLLMAVESNSWCTDPSAFCTGKGLGWGWLDCYSLFLPPASFFCGFIPLCFELMAGFSHWWALTVLAWGLLLPWLMADSRLCKLPLQLIFVTLSKFLKAPSSRSPSLSWLKKTALGMHMSSILVTWPGRCSLCFFDAPKNFSLTISLRKTEALYQPPAWEAYSPPQISINGTNFNAVYINLWTNHNIMFPG